MVIDWIDFYGDSVKEGWKEKTFIMKVESALEDYGGTEYRKQIMKRLKLYKETGMADII